MICDVCNEREATHFIRAEQASPVYCDTNACCACACGNSCGEQDEEPRVLCMTCGVERTPENMNGAHDWEIES